MSSGPGQLKGFISIISDEIENVREMILRYEEEVSFTDSKGIQPTKSMQDFDLAMQILSDLIIALDQFSNTIKDGTFQENNFENDKIKLERVRVKFTKALAGHTTGKVEPERQQIELF